MGTLFPKGNNLIDTDTMNQPPPLQNIHIARISVKDRANISQIIKEPLMRSIADLEKRIQFLEKENLYLKNLLADARMYTVSAP